MITSKPSELVKIDQLHFDTTNPRLFTGGLPDGTDDETIIRTLNDIAPLSELLLSITQNGYVDVEPLIIIKRNEGGYRVLEGNRRLATLKLLSDFDLAARLKITLPRDEGAERFVMPEKVLTLCVDSEEDVRTYIGFKHINGPYRWHAYAKARFVVGWYKAERDKGLTINRIAALLGDDNKTIRDYVSGMLVLEQAENERIFSPDDKYNRGPFAFSHLYTALGRKEYVEFLGLPPKWSDNPSDTPVPAEKIEALQEVLKYVYGSKKDGIKPFVQSQNPHIKQLGEVLVKPLALAQLRGGATLAEAYQEVRPQSEVFSEVIVAAHQSIKAVLNNVTKYSGEQHLLVIAEDIRTHAVMIEEMMRKKSEKPKSPTP
jgi:hypothetical protein